VFLEIVVVQTITVMDMLAILINVIHITATLITVILMTLVHDLVVAELVE
jgi:hypothetical protein